MILALFAVLLSTAPAGDPQISPACHVGGGDINDVCVPGYTETVRPSEVWTNALKATIIDSWPLPAFRYKASDYELDHFMPLELCGAPRARENLWMEPLKEAKQKDKDETRLHRAVCKGQMSLDDAQKYIRDHWHVYDAGATENLALPSIIPGMALAGDWDFGHAEVKTIRMLRDWENGESASRPHKEVLVYGPHPHWVAKLNQAGIRAIGMWRQNLRWPHYIVGKPDKTPFANEQFQVYIFDDMMILSPMLDALHLMFEAGRITTATAFFLYRNTHNGIVATLLRLYHWRLMDIRFHEFDIWQKEGPPPQVDFVLARAA